MGVGPGSGRLAEKVGVHGRIQGRGGGGGRGSGPPFCTCCRLFNIGPKVGPHPPFSLVVDL